MEQNNKVNKVPYIILGLALLIIIFIIFPSRIKETKLVPSFPEIPIYPLAILVSSSVEEVEVIKTPVYDAVWDSDKSIPDISKWYMESLKDNGWTIHIPAEVDNENVQFIVFKKDPNVLHLSLIKNDAGGTIITIDVFHYLYKLIYEKQNT